MRKATGIAEGAVTPVEHGSRARVEELCLTLESFGLTGFEARVLVGMLMMGSATAPQLARFAGVNRANVYRLLEGLSAKGLAASQPGGRGLWTTSGRDEVVERLRAIEEQRHRTIETKAERAGALLAALGPEVPAMHLPQVHVLRGAAEISALYRRLIQKARQEVLVLNRGPYLSRPAPVPEVLDRAHEVRMRALWAVGELETVLRPWLDSIDAYQAAGVDQRVVDEDLPLRLAIIDGRHLLTTLEDDEQPVPGYPTPLYVDHAGFARAHRMVFEELWQRSRPYASWREVEATDGTSVPAGPRRDVSSA